MYKQTYVYVCYYDCFLYLFCFIYFLLPARSLTALLKNYILRNNKTVEKST